MNAIELTIHTIAIAVLVAAAAGFGLLVSWTWGVWPGVIAGGLLGASMVMRYIERATSREFKA